MDNKLSKGNYWYVDMICSNNFAVDDENYERMKAAMEADKPCVEVVDALGATMLVNLRNVAHIDESTPATRDSSYEWNKACDEDGLDRRRRLGAPPKDFDD